MNIYRFAKNSDFKIPMFISPVSAGFPSPAEDYIESKLDLNELLIKHPSSTFFVRVSGTSMLNAGIFPDDILIVDKSIQPKNNSIVIAVLDGEFLVKRFVKANNRYFLFAENREYKPIEINRDSDFAIWGVVTNVIHSVQK